MKKIIVPIDFSEHSEYALKTAAKLAKEANAELLVLHMLELSDVILTESDSQQQQKAVFFLKLVEQKFETFLDKEYLKDVNVTPIVKHYKVFSEVNDVAKEHDVDLIVMGSHGTSGFKEFFVGSNTERVVRNSQTPVLVIKNEIKDINFGTAVFATSFEEENVRPYLNATSMFKALGAKLKLLYVNLPNEHFKSSVEIEKKIAEFLITADGNLDKLNDVAYQADYTVEQGVMNYANKVGADIIAIPTHGRKGISHFFAGSIGEDIANHSPLPVITFMI
ncbi:universal stress protein [Flavobacteriaceae bacterium S0825]|uniref:universal stress protein n=1 Tax=Gaetbulibacter sp. S0825 TaxID=2720084 RepID=UPI001430E791|nr:universal stress protein [Gaetbulibacter sp. S0825]MCK0109267.1 universal stress protein [Flavobacteriaceae bacterium S0825]NIX64902.1 universal stress protein [Gaetbulibacter sp. S0825]